MVWGGERTKRRGWRTTDITDITTETDAIGRLK
jgi:hypothetical protein